MIKITRVLSVRSNKEGQEHKKLDKFLFNTETLFKSLALRQKWKINSNRLEDHDIFDAEFVPCTFRHHLVRQKKKK